MSYYNSKGEAMKHYMGFTIPADAVVIKYWETTNFGWLSYKTADGKLHLAKH